MCLMFGERFVASTNKTRPKRLSDRLARTKRFLAVEFLDQPREGWFNIGENRVMPPGVATLVQGKLAIHQEVVKSALFVEAETALCGLNLFP